MKPRSEGIPDHVAVLYSRVAHDGGIPRLKWQNALLSEVQTVFYVWSNGCGVN